MGRKECERIAGDLDISTYASHLLSTKLFVVKLDSVDALPHSQSVSKATSLAFFGQRGRLRIASALAKSIAVIAVPLLGTERASVYCRGVPSLTPS